MGDLAIFLRFLSPEKGLLLERLQRDNEKSVIVWREGEGKRERRGREKKRRRDFVSDCRTVGLIWVRKTRGPTVLKARLNPSFQLGAVLYRSSVNFDFASTSLNRVAVIFLRSFPGTAHKALSIMQ